MIMAIYPTILIITTLITSIILFYYDAYNDYKRFTKKYKHTKLTYNQLIGLIKKKNVHLSDSYVVTGNMLNTNWLEIENIGILLSFKDWIRWNYTYGQMKKKQKKQNKQDNYIENYFK